MILGNKITECRLIVFDKNGTLVDQHLVLLELARARKKNVQGLFGEKTSELWERIVGVDLKNEKIDHSGPLATAPCREELLIAAAAFYLSGYSWNEAKELAHKAYGEADESMKPPYRSVLLDGVAEVLKELKGHGLKLAVASTDTHKRTVESFKALRILSLFDAVIGSDDVKSGNLLQT